MKLTFDVLKNEDKKPLRIYDFLIITNSAYDNPSLQVLIDSGATIPVWVGDSSVFMQHFPDSYLYEARGKLGGFGLYSTYPPIYIIPSYILRDKKGNYIEFVDLPIMIESKNYSFDMIISFTMLQKLNYYYEYYDTNSGTSFNAPKFRILTDRSQFGCNKRITKEKITIDNVEYPIFGDMSVFAQ